MPEPKFEYALPPAASAIEALRGIGYNLRTAIADLVDNSISAGAKNVWIDFEWRGADSAVSILDDGVGMDSQKLANAMIIGSQSPLESRPPRDLGRFGLGLKTASFSQCRRMIVASKSLEGSVSIRQWDLDYVSFHNEWRVLLSGTAASQPSIGRLEGFVSGTVVRWELLDHILGDHPIVDESSRSRFFSLVEGVRAHLGMVFHRFIAERPAASIYINGTKSENLVAAWDPFCIPETATQASPEQSIGGEGSVTGFVLPHRDRFSSRGAFDVAAGPNGWSAQQGFYVYRGKRLLLAGGWLGLGRERTWQREEQFKLARLRLDITNASDRAWQIDVKKSVARPPVYVRPLLTDLAERIRTEARRVFAFRGSYRPKQSSAPVVPTWLAGRDARNHSTYKINREHPTIADMLARDSVSRRELEHLLELVEATVPVQRVWLDLAERPELAADPRSSLNANAVQSLAMDLWKALVTSRGLSTRAATAEVLRSEPFNLFPELADVLGALEGGTA